MGHNEYEPIVLLIENEICGHAGLIPINIKVNNQIKKSIWFTDFFVDTKYRSLGFGKHLTEQWMKICPTQITLCNEKSLKIFKKFNWSYNNNFLKKIKILNYFNVITGLKYLNNSNFSKKEKIEDFEVKRVENKLIVKLAEKCEFKYLNQSNYIIRDENWFKWRIVDCPYKKDIFILCYKNEYIVVHIFEKRGIKTLNVIFSSNKIDLTLINILTIFSKKNNIDFMSFIGEKNNFFDGYLPGQRNINFAFYSQNSIDMKGINNFKDLQFIDSDIDFI